MKKVICGVLAISMLCGCGMNLTGCGGASSSGGYKNEEDAAEAWWEAQFNADADAIMKMIPESIRKGFSDEFSLTENQMKKLVSEVLEEEFVEELEEASIEKVKVKADDVEELDTDDMQTINEDLNYYGDGILSEEGYEVTCTFSAKVDGEEKEGSSDSCYVIEYDGKYYVWDAMNYVYNLLDD